MLYCIIRLKTSTVCVAVQFLFRKLKNFPRQRIFISLKLQFYFNCTFNFFWDVHGILNRDYSIENLTFSSAFLYDPYTLDISGYIFLFFMIICFKLNGLSLDCVFFFTAFSFEKFQNDRNIYYPLFYYLFLCSFSVEVISDNIFQTN